MLNERAHNWTTQTAITHCSRCGRIVTDKDDDRAACPRCGSYGTVDRRYNLKTAMADALAAAANWDVND